jgi:hypothetical protein
MYTIEKEFKIWNDSFGYRYEVGEDPDGLGSVEIRYVEDNGKTLTRITIDRKALPLMIQALQEKLNEEIV